MDFITKGFDLMDGAMQIIFPDVTLIDAQHLAKLKIVTTKEDFKLCSETSMFYCVLQKLAVSPQAYSMIRVASQPEAIKQFNLFSSAIQPLLAAAGTKLLNNKDLLEQLADSLRPNPGWSCAHLAAKLGLVECFSTTAVANVLSDPDKVTGVTPIMVAAQAECTAAIQELIAKRVKLDYKDNKGNTVFHYIVNCKHQHTIQLFNKTDKKHLGGSLDLENNDGKTPFQLAIDAKKQSCAVGLLVVGADPDKSLRAAITSDSVEFVKIALVLGADVNRLVNNVSPLQLVHTRNGSNRKAIKNLLCRVGATLSGEPVADVATTSGCDASNYPAAGDRVLCLDGGGIRGLVLIQVLMAIEKATGKLIKDTFEWISGTSIGGIVTLMLAQGFSTRAVLGMFFELKDVVFSGSRVFDPTPLENCLKRYYGETTLMSQLKSPPRVFVTCVVGDRCPSELNLFRNYEVPDNVVNMAKVNNPAQLTFEPLPRPDETYVWQAARSTSAAPTLYPEFERYLDGGLVANNPTVDTLTEIHQINDAMKRKGQSTQPIKVVASLGTGIAPLKAFQTCNIYKPSGPIDLFNVISASMNMVELIVDQATQANGRAVERAAAWCKSINVAYHRYSAAIKDVDIACTDDTTLIDMLWDTQCDVYDNRTRIKELVSLLTTRS